MTPTRRFLACAALAAAIIAPRTEAQQLPAQVELSLSGSFSGGVAESDSSVLLYDNDLTNGYNSGFDLHDAPASLASGGPAGSAAFQWGTPSTYSSYPHASALWFTPLATGPLQTEEYFEIGHLFYRNGTIRTNTGASSVNLQLTLDFTSPEGMDPLALTFQSNLVNTVNSSDAVGSADIVTLHDSFEPISFTDAAGNQYFFELSFQVDSDTMDGTLSSADQFRVYEGQQGVAVLLGRVTTNPFGITGVPEPSSLVLALGGALLALRRRR